MLSIISYLKFKYLMTIVEMGSLFTTVDTLPGTMLKQRSFCSHYTLEYIANYAVKYLCDVLYCLFDLLIKFRTK